MIPEPDLTYDSILSGDQGEQFVHHVEFEGESNKKEPWLLIGGYNTCGFPPTELRIRSNH